MAVAMVLTTTFAALPLTAAEPLAQKPVIGSVSAVGSVALRGVGISQDGTLFAGDSIRAYEKGYAKVLMRTGTKIEIFENAEVGVNLDNQGVQIAMNAGMVGFTAHTPLRVEVSPFEVTANSDASGNVAIISATMAGVRAIRGTVTVRNLKTSESFEVPQGEERVLGLQNGVHAPSLGQLASNLPQPVPAPSSAPQAPAGSTSGRKASPLAWLAVIGGTVATIWSVAEAHKSTDVTDTATIHAADNLQAIANTTAQQQAQVTSIATVATQAQQALLASGNTAQAALAADIATQAAQSATRLAALQAQVSTYEAQLSRGSGSQQQLQNLLNLEEQERQNSNALANQLATLLNNNRNTNGIPGGGIGTVGAPAISSASVPSKF